MDASHARPAAAGDGGAAVLPDVYVPNEVARNAFLFISTLVVVIPTAGFIVAMVLALGYGVGFGAVEAWLLGIGYSLTIIGIGAGYHRLFSHRSYKTVTPVRVLLGIFGSMAGQGPVLFWAAIHRRHHQFADTPGDSHSPYMKKDRELSGLSGFWHAHTGWLFDPEITNWGRYVPDLLKDRAVFRVNQAYFLWVLLGLIIPAVIGGVAHGSWEGAATGFLWGGLVRMFLVHHSTWCINSVCHIFGNQPFKTKDHARNNWIVAILTFGEGWHNNHHAFPYSCSHRFRWWQYDPNGWVVSLLSVFGLAWDMKYPSERAIAENTVSR